MSYQKGDKLLCIKGIDKNTPGSYPRTEEIYTFISGYKTDVAGEMKEVLIFEEIGVGWWSERFVLANDKTIEDCL